MSDFVPTGDQQALVACPFVKLDPERWLMHLACGYRKPWSNLKTLLRHHTIGSHRTTNKRLLDARHSDAIDDGLFEKLDAWLHEKKDWNSPEHCRARWYEVCAIIATWLNMELPRNLDPEWTQEWARIALNQGQPVEMVHSTIFARQDIKREAQALVNHIKDKQRSHQRERALRQRTIAQANIFANKLKSDNEFLDAQHEQELNILKASLREMVLPHDCAPEFLVQVEPEAFENAAGISGAASSSQTSYSNQSQNSNMPHALPILRPGTDTNIPDALDTTMYTTLGYPSPALRDQQQSMSSADSYGNRSSWNTSAFYDYARHSMNSTALSSLDYNEVIGTMRTEIADEDFPHPIMVTPCNIEDLNGTNSMDDITFTADLANPNFDPNLHL